MRLIHATGEDRGAVAVMVALSLPMLILFASFAIDVGNWFVHGRHLQMQADAGALAAAGDFHFPCNNAAIESRAKEYAGDESAGFNHQLGGTPLGNINFALNSRNYPGGSPKTDPTVVPAPPCEAGMIDVKLTETDLPLFFRIAGLFGSLPFINAHARVQIFSKRFVAGALPVAVPDTNPRKARVTFIDEQTGEVLGTRELTRAGASNELAIWDNASEPLPLTVNREKIGVRVALSGGTSTTCGAPLVECYDAGSSGGILFVRGYSMAGSGKQPNPPLARNVYLLAGTCGDAYFSRSEATCGIGLHADVDFGPCSEIEKVAPTLTAVAGGNKYALKRTGCTGTSTSTWETTGSPIVVTPGAGPIPVTLEWAETKGKEAGNECKSTGGNKCTGSFGVVQRTFAASDARSGPIRLAQIWEGASSGADSFERCSEVQPSCTHELVVRIGVKQNLQENATSVEQPPVALRVFHEAVNNPSQNQALDCDPAIPNLREEIARGCEPKYAINEGTACPSSSALWASPEPWECVAIQTGGAVNQIFQGMNKRILGSEEPKAGECTNPNEWSTFPNLNYGNDPRIVPVFLTPFGSFSGSGNEAVPVTNFGTFYVTGWAGQGGGNTSQSICSTDDPAEPGTIVGHFIKYVQTLNDGSASEEPCEFSAPTPCVAVLTE